MPLSNYFSNVVTIRVDFLCLEFKFSMCSCFKKYQDSFLGSGCRLDKLLIISTLLGRRRSAVSRDRPPIKIAMALQRAAKARLYKLPLDATVQSRRPDLIEFGGLPALALLRDKLAVRTARRKLQRPRAGAGEREAAVTAP